jgi:hypothetical protein
MNNVSINKITSVVLVFVMLSHMIFMHSFLENYVICYGNDGHIEIENVNDSESCDDHSLAEYRTSSIISNSDCQDFNLEENCFNDEQLIFQNQIKINAGIKKEEAFISDLKNKFQTFIKIETNIYFNNTLENYSTISLLI